MFIYLFSFQYSFFWLYDLIIHFTYISYNLYREVTYTQFGSQLLWRYLLPYFQCTTWRLELKVIRYFSYQYVLSNSRPVFYLISMAFWVVPDFFDKLILTSALLGSPFWKFTFYSTALKISWKRLFVRRSKFYCKIS